MTRYGWTILAYCYVLVGVLVVGLFNPLPGSSFVASRRRMLALPILAPVWPILLVVWLFVWRPRQRASAESERAMWEAIARHKKDEP